MLSFTRRSNVLGLPIGPRRTDWEKVTQLGAGLIAFAAGLGLTGLLMRGSDGELREGDADQEQPAGEDGDSRERG